MRTHLYTAGEPIEPPATAQYSLFVVARGTVSLRTNLIDTVETPETPSASGAETSIWRQRMIDRIASEYAEHIGPIAGTVARNAARHCDDPYKLYQLLAKEIVDPDSRAAFLSNAPTHGSRLLRRGDHFRSAAYVSGRPQHRAEMHALDEVELVELDRQSLLQAMKDNPERGTEFCHRLADTDAVASAAVGAGLDGPHV